ncbi:MAG: response regulator [Cyclobacteriaceae bacterium]
MQSPLRCLAIDDDKLFLRKISVYMEDIEWLNLVDTANHPVRGAKAIFDVQPNIVLLDMEMPHIDGNYLVDWVSPRLEKMENAPHIIVVSSLDFAPEDRLPGIKGYINKSHVTSGEALAKLIKDIID